MAKKDQQIKLVIVEDDIFLADLYRTKFELEGMSVLVAYDGEKGMELIEKNIPDIVLLDLILPKMSGFLVLEKMKTTKKLKDIPVILLTNLSQKADVEKGLKMGADDYLIKAHFMPSEVVNKIKEKVKA
ncbi:MAG TPA: response regulator [bacterium]|nr:response regulator [bacterium]HNS34330.1 response regulator [bacterium]HNZ73582.1 response regulator [bacterium]HOH67551.1 response regulator [bacterium]